MASRDDLFGTTYQYDQASQQRALARLRARKQRRVVPEPATNARTAGCFRHAADDECSVAPLSIAAWLVDCDSQRNSVGEIA